MLRDQDPVALSHRIACRCSTFMRRTEFRMQLDALVSEPAAGQVGFRYQSANQPARSASPLRTGRPVQRFEAAVATSGLAVCCLVDHPVRVFLRQFMGTGHSPRLNTPDTMDCWSQLDGDSADDSLQDERSLADSDPDDRWRTQTRWWRSPI